MAACVVCQGAGAGPHGVARKCECSAHTGLHITPSGIPDTGHGLEPTHPWVRLAQGVQGMHSHTQNSAQVGCMLLCRTLGQHAHELACVPVCYRHIDVPGPDRGQLRKQTVATALISLFVLKR